MKRLLEIGSGPIHLIDESNPRHPVLVCLTPNRFALRLHSCHPTKYRDGSVQNTKRSLHFRRKIHVSRGVDNVDAILCFFESFGDSDVFLHRPKTGGCRRCNRNSALPLLLHPVGHGGSLVNLTHLVNTSGVEKNALGQRCFACVDVSTNSNIPCSLQRVATG